MSRKIHFFDKGRWAGGSRIPNSFRNMTNLSLWIGFFLKKVKNTGKSYLKFISNDTTLVGQEKANLVIELDKLLGGLFQLRKYLAKDNKNSFQSLDNDFYYFHIMMDQCNWQGEGKISPKESDINFVDWYNTSMLTKIKKIFTEYAKAMSDKILTEEERYSLLGFIENTIADILKMERTLVLTDIKK